MRNSSTCLDLMSAFCASASEGFFDLEKFSRMTAMNSESMTKVRRVTKLMKYGSANMVPQCLVRVRVRVRIRVRVRGRVRGRVRVF